MLCTEKVREFKRALFEHYVFELAHIFPCGFDLEALRQLWSIDPVFSYSLSG